MFLLYFIFTIKPATFVFGLKTSYEISHLLLFCLSSWPFSHYIVWLFRSCSDRAGQVKLVTFHICHCFLDFQSQLNLLFFHLGYTTFCFFFILFLIFYYQTSNFCSYFHVGSICADFHVLAQENTRKLSKIKVKENTHTYGRGRQGPLSQLRSLKISQLIKMVHRES